MLWKAIGLGFRRAAPSQVNTTTSGCREPIGPQFGWNRTPAGTKRLGGKRQCSLPSIHAAGRLSSGPRSSPRQAA
jgi:hypothetical protein